MKFKFVLKILSVFLMASCTLSGEEPALLQRSDIHKIMQQILSQHAEKKQVTGTIIKNSLKVYIEQFDPFRTYLLESEVRPFLHLSEKELETIASQYAENNYEIYEKLGDVIRKAILRNRTLRSELGKNAASDLQKTLNLSASEMDALVRSKKFAQSEEELKTRLENQFKVLFNSEKKRYGEAYVLKNQAAIVDIYDKRLRSFEKQYLANKDDNLFVMHILKSMASSLDAHTEFYNPAEAYDMKMHLENSFQGVGLSLQDSPEGIIVDGLVPGSPAAKSGLVKKGDQIVEVDGKNVLEEEVNRVSKWLQGAPGSTATLLVKRKVTEGGQVVDKQLTIKLKREAVSIDQDRVVITSEVFGNGIIGKIKLNSFYQNDQGVSSEKDVREAISKLEKEGNLRGLILDLRENTGGFLSQAVKVAGLFITNGVIVISKYSSGEERVFRDMDGKTFYNGPLVILTSKMTASAAEIVAESLQDYGVALVVGDQHTYGKGTVQTQTVTQDKASSFFKVTIGKYYTVSGKTPQIEGVIADVVVPGKHAYEKVGEAFLGGTTLKNDTIEATFDDKFKDLDPLSKAWYFHYYVPTEQKKLDFWKEMIPVLRKNSEYRISQNKNYQTYLSRLKGEPVETKINGNEDLQLLEAVNVLKDMIYLESKFRTDTKK